MVPPTSVPRFDLSVMSTGVRSPCRRKDQRIPLVASTSGEASNISNVMVSSCVSSTVWLTTFETTLGGTAS